MFKQSGRINTDQYHVLIQQIVADAIKASRCNQMTFHIGTYEVNGDKLDIIGTFERCSVSALFISNIKPGENNKIKIFYDNFYPTYDPKFATELTSVLHHEFTHLLDKKYTPYKRQDPDQVFDKEFTKIFDQDSLHTTALLYELFNKEISAEKIYKILLKKVINNPVFKELMGQTYNLISQLVREKYYSMMYNSQDYKEKYTGYQIYHNSHEEIKAYLTQIILEIQDFLKTKKGIKFQKELNTKSLSWSTQHALEQSNLWKKTESILNKDNKKVFFSEVGKYLQSIK